MLGNKQKIEFKEPEFQEVIYEKTKIKVKPFLSLTDQITLLTIYLDEYFSEEKERVLKSEYQLVFGVLDLCTNVNIEELSLDSLLSNYGVWENVKKKIANYGEFRALLARTIDEIKESKRLEKSLGSAIEGIFESVQSILKTDISPESIEKLQQLLKDVDESKIFNKVTEIYKDKK